jgi:hypothetical protein
MAPEEVSTLVCYPRLLEGRGGRAELTTALEKIAAALRMASAPTPIEPSGLVEFWGIAYERLLAAMTEAVPEWRELFMLPDAD